MEIRELPPIDTASLFSWKGSIKKGDKVVVKKMLNPPYLIPPMGEYLSEEEFAEVGVAWSEGGISITLFINQAFKESFFPAVDKGDGVEIFIDTRGIEGASVIHKYCHHFVFLPKPVEEISGIEITKFRGEDRHDLCDPLSLVVESTFARSSYTMEILIPEMSLFGYDPLEYPRISFAFRVHRSKGEPQHFPISFVDYKVEGHPTLWAIMDLVK